MAVNLLPGCHLLGLQEAGQRGPLLMRGRDHGGTSEAAKEALFLSRFPDELGHGSTEPIDRDGHGQSSHRLLLARQRGYIIIDIVRS